MNMKKNSHKEIEKQFLLLQRNSSKDLEQKFQNIFAELKRMDEKSLHPTEIMNIHPKNHPRPSLTKEGNTETPCGPATGTSSSTCTSEQNNSVLMDLEPVIFTNIGSDYDANSGKHCAQCAVNMSEDVYLRAEIGVFTLHHIVKLGLILV